MLFNIYRKSDLNITVNKHRSLKFIISGKADFPEWNLNVRVLLMYESSQNYFCLLLYMENWSLNNGEQLLRLSLLLDLVELDALARLLGLCSYTHHYSKTPHLNTALSKYLILSVLVSFIIWGNVFLWLKFYSYSNKIIRLKSIHGVDETRNVLTCYEIYKQIF